MIRELWSTNCVRGGLSCVRWLSYRLNCVPQHWACGVVWCAVVGCGVVGQRATVVVKNDNTCERASGRKAEWHWRRSGARCEDYLIGCLLLGRGKHPPTFLTTHKSLNSLWRWGGNRDRIPFFPSILTWSDSLGIFLKKTPSFEFSNCSEVHNVSKIYPSTNISQ